MEQLAHTTIGNLIIWLLTILGTWSFFKDVPQVISKVRGWWAQWRAKNSIKSAQQWALNQAVSLDKFSELRDPQALRIHGIVLTNFLIFLAVLSANLLAIALFLHIPIVDPEQSDFYILGIPAFMITMVAGKLFMHTYYRMKVLKNLDIETELVRARLLKLSSLYPEDELLQHIRTTVDKLYPKATNLPTDPAELRKLRRDLGVF